MNVLQVSAYAAPFKGNFVDSLIALGKQLKLLGHRIVFAFPENAQQCNWIKEVKAVGSVYFLPLAKAKILPITYYKLKRILNTEDIDIAHSHFELYDIPLSIVAPKSVTIFWHVHDAIYENESVKYSVPRKIQYKFLSKRAVLLSVSDYYRKCAVAKGMPENRTITVLNGITLPDLESINNRDIEYDFLFFGWDYHRKGGDIFLSACDKLSQMGYNFKIIYNGNKDTIPFIKEYIDSKVDWFTFSYPVSDVNVLYKKCRTLISASRKETFSYTVCEASYIGLSIIASDIYGLEWAKELPTVSMFESENVEDLVVLLRERLIHPMLDSKDIEKSRTIIEKKYSVDNWVKTIMNIYGI